MLCFRRVVKPGQGGALNLLFICSANRLRSPTAERIFSAYPGVQAIGAGTSSSAKTPVSWRLIEWADIVLVMEKSHRDEVAKTYGDLLKGKRLVCLDIPDHYELMQPELITLLKERVPEYVRLSAVET
tara:strand:+ start:713 stop:1096 length:384 start_codon:yes stop_codon:yes gene_type:complete